MERKVGDIFECEVYGKLKVVEYIRDEQDDKYAVSLGEFPLISCDKCVLGDDNCDKFRNVIGECDEDFRPNREEVYFVKVGV